MLAILANGHFFKASGLAPWLKIVQPLTALTKMAVLMASPIAITPAKKKRAWE